MKRSPVAPLFYAHRNSAKIARLSMQGPQNHFSRWASLCRQSVAAHIRLPSKKPYGPPHGGP